MGCEFRKRSSVQCSGLHGIFHTDEGTDGRTPQTFPSERSKLECSVSAMREQLSLKSSGHLVSLTKVLSFHAVFHTLLVVWWVRSPNGCIYCCLRFVVMVTETATTTGNETDFMICFRCNQSPDFPVVLGSEIWLHMNSVCRMK